MTARQQESTEVIAQPDLPEDLPWLQPHWARLRERFAENQKAPPHALMLVGSPGSGRLVTARHLACWLLCQQPAADAACGQCRSCRLLQAGSHPDLLHVQQEEDANTIKVDQVRALIESLNLTAGFNGWRIAIIEQASSMTDNAANALLKTLEEPGAQTLLLLLVDTRKALPATIYSRCQQWLLTAPDADLSMQWLQRHSDQDAASLQLALQLALGAPLQAWNLLHDDSLTEAKAIAGGLQSLATGGGDVTGVLTQWQNIPPARCWHWIQHQLHRCCRELFLSGAQAETALPDCCKLYAEASKSLALTTSGLRQDLQLQAWLLQWRALCESHAIMRNICAPQSGMSGTKP
jgi:DNA polymerase-3 subunit delta'